MFKAVFEVGTFLWPLRALLRLVCKENSKEVKLCCWDWQFLWDIPGKQDCEGCGCKKGGLAQDCQDQWVQRPPWKTPMSWCHLLGWDNEPDAHRVLEMELWVLACLSRTALRTALLLFCVHLFSAGSEVLSTCDTQFCLAFVSTV